MKPPPEPPMALVALTSTILSVAPLTRITPPKFMDRVELNVHSWISAVDDVSMKITPPSRSARAWETWTRAMSSTELARSTIAPPDTAARALVMTPSYRFRVPEKGRRMVWMLGQERWQEGK
eukprot:3113966-Prymnesium_polylepis.1